jgi:hypothetical protein
MHVLSFSSQFYGAYHQTTVYFSLLSTCLDKSNEGSQKYGARMQVRTHQANGHDVARRDPKVGLDDADDNGGSWGDREEVDGRAEVADDAAERALEWAA